MENQDQTNTLTLSQVLGTGQPKTNKHGNTTNEIIDEALAEDSVIDSYPDKSQPNNQLKSSDSLKTFLNPLHDRPSEIDTHHLKSTDTSDFDKQLKAAKRQSIEDEEIRKFDREFTEKQVMQLEKEVEELEKDQQYYEEAEKEVNYHRVQEEIKTKNLETKLKSQISNRNIDNGGNLIEFLAVTRQDSARLDDDCMNPSNKGLKNVLEESIEQEDDEDEKLLEEAWNGSTRIVPMQKSKVQPKKVTNQDWLEQSMPNDLKKELDYHIYDEKCKTFLERNQPQLAINCLDEYL